MARPTMTPAEAVRCAPGTTVKVRGVIGVGDAGPLTAPISGLRCAWYRSYVQPGNWLLRPLPSAGRFSDIMLVAQPSHAGFRRDDPTDEISESSFTVVGTDGVAVRIDPRVADVNSDRVARNRVVSSRLGLMHQLLVEFTLPIGAEVVLLGGVGAGGTLAASEDAFVLVSTRSDAKIIDRSAHGVGERNMSMAMFRFVRRGNRLSRGLARFDRLLAVVVLVILVLLVISLL